MYRLGSQLRDGFLRLPAPARRSLLSALGRRAPWDLKYDHLHPPEAPGLITGPPDVVGIGVQKAGTTWWHSLIAGHPGFYDHPGFHKERHFFSRYYARDFPAVDVSAYHGWFPRPAGRLTGEWTPDYLHQHWTPELLHQAAPDAKLLVLLRDPVERYRSGLAHYAEQGYRVTPMIATDAFARGLYADALERYERLWGRDAILVLQYEACRDDPHAHLGETLRFLGLDDSWRPEGATAPVNRTRGARVGLSAREEATLADRYAADMWRVAERFGSINLTYWPAARRAGLVPA